MRYGCWFRVGRTWYRVADWSVGLFLNAEERVPDFIFTLAV